jgi:hypothetical protein
MTLRQWYAGMAMQGKLSGGGIYDKWVDMAFDAFAIADAMIAYEENES